MVQKITSPADTALNELCDHLAQLAPSLERPGAWPADQLRRCGDAGVFEWFLPGEVGGQEWSAADIAQGYFRLAAACLTTTFVITQLIGANRRVAGGENNELRSRLIPELMRGEQLATVGISHLTTSRRHLSRPALCFREDANSILLDGFSPWVTGADHCNYVLVGAAEEEGGQQVLILVPLDHPGVSIDVPAELVGLSASRTGAVRFSAARVSRDWLVAGPVENVMQGGVGAGTGGIQTSTLAVGLSIAAVEFLRGECEKREELEPATEKLEAELSTIRQQLIEVAEGTSSLNIAEVRTRANSLVSRAAQAALVAAKGTGYVIGHPAGRWCREALFFLVWSCPQPVLEANLCELAGLEISGSSDTNRGSQI